MTEPRIYMRHVQQIKGNGVSCANGMREWCKQNGVDLHKFAKEGVDGEVALRIGDAFCMRLLKIAREEANGQQQFPDHRL